jgi:predicted transcriptional regulator of viral defense system
VKSGSRNDSTYNPSLSQREVRLLSGWERERRVIVTIAEIRTLVGEARATDVAHELVRKRALQRVRPGTYLVRPFRSIGRATLHSTAIAAEALLQGEPHYLGGLWALSFHQLTEQRYESILDVFLTHRLASRVLGAARVRFHVLPPRAFEYGTIRAAIEGVPVHVSDVERTLLDAFDHPRIFLGISRALELAKSQLGRVDRHRLIAHAIAGSKPSTCQRLGVLLERTGERQKTLTQLHAKARQTRSLLSLNPDAPRKGPVNRRWNVVENDP